MQLKRINRSNAMISAVNRNLIFCLIVSLLNTLNFSKFTLKMVLVRP